jgi:sodium/potassium-transporting ATPase subunit alpha
MNQPEDAAVLGDQHRIPMDDLLARLHCSDVGLTTDDAAQRLIEFGSNELRVRKETPEIVKFLRQFTNFFALLLIVGSSLA